jgi:hypothetical protein
MILTLRTQNDLLTDSSLETKTRVFSAIFLLNLFASCLFMILQINRKFKGKCWQSLASYWFATFATQLVLWPIENNLIQAATLLKRNEDNFKIGTRGVRTDLQFCQLCNARKMEKYQFITQERWKNIAQNVV